jgi:large subunit ribosomal protein L17
MRHLKKRRTLGRIKKQREALLSGLAASLMEHGKICTTEARAKEMRPLAERLITYAKKESSVEGYRLLSPYISKATSKKVINEIASKYKERKGGYTRIIKLPRRLGDAARMAFIELV